VERVVFGLAREDVHDQHRDGLFGPLVLLDFGGREAALEGDEHAPLGLGNERRGGVQAILDSLGAAVEQSVARLPHRRLQVGGRQRVVEVDGALARRFGI